MATRFNKYGAWVVNRKLYDTKLEALQAATAEDAIPGFYFHNHVWEEFDRSLLGKIPLHILYKERALQLREKYDHLVLHYSGGSDSHNILHTFITNNIKLDEISVRWAKPLMDGKFYTPNRMDLSARNAASEWDYTIKPTLDALKLSHPEIKITVYDFTENLADLTLTHDSMVNRVIEMNNSRGAFASVLQRIDGRLDDKSTVSRAEKTGHIFGVEKPMLSMTKDAIMMQFTDAGLDTSSMVRGQLEENVELFYWSHDLPLLPMEQAYQAALWFKTNVHYRNLLWSNPERMSVEEGNRLFDAVSFTLKSILYPHSWDKSKFQVRKPNAARSDWWFWLHESPELTKLSVLHKAAMEEVTQGLSSRHVVTAEGIRYLAPVGSKRFHVLSL